MSSSQPYHTRTDSQPFSYIRVNHTSNKHAVDSGGGRLESPRLLRKMMMTTTTTTTTTGKGDDGENHRDSFASDGIEFENGFERRPYNEEPYFTTTNPESNFETNIPGRNDLAFSNNKERTKIPIEKPESEIRYVPIVTDIPCQRSTKEDDSSLTWLQKQQKKLRERREMRYLQTRPQSSSQDPFIPSSDAVLMRELKTSLRRIESATTDGYASDLYSDPTSRESSPVKTTDLFRQKSDTSYDRVRPVGINKRVNYDSETESEDHGSLDSRPITPAFPSGTPYNGRKHWGGGGNSRAPSPNGSLYQHHSLSRRGSVGSNNYEISEVSAQNVKLVKDNFKYWYKPHISREGAINLLKGRPTGTFVVRDSNSFPGAFGLALKVSTPPTQVKRGMSDPEEELIRHFLIEPTSKGVKLKGYSNEPVFASLSALVYQHTLTSLALPAKLVLPQRDLHGDSESSSSSLSSSSATTASTMKQLLSVGAACDVMYLYSMEVDSLTGPAAVSKTANSFFDMKDTVPTVKVHFKVSTQGITVTDNARKLFFRKHYSVPSISYCGVDPDGRTWNLDDAKNSSANKVFAFVAKKPGSRSGGNQCHLYSTLDPEQPAKAIVNFVNKVMLNNSTGGNRRSDVV